MHYIISKKTKFIATILAMAVLLTLLPFQPVHTVHAASSAPTGEYVFASSNVYYNFYANGTPITIEASIPSGAVPGTVPGYTEPTGHITAYIVWTISGTTYYVGTGSYWGTSPNNYCYVFGGGKSDIATDTSVTVNGGTVYCIYGGNYASSLTANTSVVINGGMVSTVYGGNYIGAMTGDTSVILTGGTINLFIYGGNHLNTTSNTSVHVSGGLVYGIYGGGESGSVTGNADINISGGRIVRVIGGGLNNPVQGDVTVNITGGMILGYTPAISKGSISASSKYNLYISGGTIGFGIESGLSPVVSAIDNTPVEQYKLTVGSVENNTILTKVVSTEPALGYTYGTNDLKADSMSRILVYLPHGKTAATVKVGSTYYTGTITSNESTLSVGSATAVGISCLDSLTTATGYVTIALPSSLTGLTGDNFFVRKDGVLLTNGTDYTIDDTDPFSQRIIFTAAAELKYNSVVTVFVEKSGYDVSSGITLINSIPMNTPVITTSTLPHGNIGTAYSQTISYTGDSPITWSLSAGNLPNGLVLSGNSIIGTPTGTGTYNFTVRAENGGGNDTQAFSLVIDPIAVTSFNLSSLITAPVKAQTPSTSSINASQYTGSVSWSPSDGTFKGGTVYTATVSLTAKTNYTFSGIAANSFSYSGAASVTNNAGSGTVTIVFPATAARVLSSITVKTAPTTTSYHVGDSFAPAGLVLTLHYDDGTTADIAYSDATKAGFSFNKATMALTDTSVQITYGGKNISQSISVSACVVYDITYHLNNGTNPTGAPTTYVEGTGATLPVNVTRSGFSFGGWYTNDQLTGSAVTQITASDSGNKSYWAKWTALPISSITIKTAPYLTTYHAGDSFNPVGLVITLHYSDSSAADIAYSDATKAGFSFNKTVLVSADTTVQITYGTKNASQPITVIAQPDQVVSYTITYHLNGGSNPADAPQTYIQGKGTGLPTSVTRGGYIFGGWYTNTALSGKAITEISSADSGNKEYWAKWTLISGEYDPGSTPGKPAAAIFTPDKTNLTNTDVIVQIFYPKSAAIKKYSVDGGATWLNYTHGVVFRANGTLLAKSQNSSGVWSDVATYQVTNIDKSAPKVSGILDTKYYNTDRKITFSDGLATINNRPFRSGSTVRAQGRYIVVVRDSAGNVTIVRFTIDKTKPVITAKLANGTAVLPGKSYKTSKVAVTINENNIRITTMTVNGKKKVYPRNNVLTAKGKYVITVTDKAGNKSSITFTIE